MVWSSVMATSTPTLPPPNSTNPSRIWGRRRVSVGGGNKKLSPTTGRECDSRGSTRFTWNCWSSRAQPVSRPGSMISLQPITRPTVSLTLALNRMKRSRRAISVPRSRVVFGGGSGAGFQSMALLSLSEPGSPTRPGLRVFVRQVCDLS